MGTHQDEFLTEPLDDRMTLGIAISKLELILPNFMLVRNIYEVNVLKRHKYGTSLYYPSSYSLKGAIHNLRKNHFNPLSSHSWLLQILRCIDSNSLNYEIPLSHLTRFHSILRQF